MEELVDWLNEARAERTLHPLLVVAIFVVQRQMRRLADKLEREKVVMASLPDLALRILDHARDHGRVAIGDMARLTGANRNTLKEHLRALVAKRHLVQHGAGRGTWYSLP